MMARSAPLVLGLATLAMLAASPGARAQCRLCDKPVTIPLLESSENRIELQVETGIDFDRLVVVSAGAGTATLLPDGTRQVTGSVGAIGGRGMVGEARVRGEPGRLVRIDLPAHIQLHSVDGAQISIDEIVTDLPSMPRLDSAGNLSFRFGGRIHLSGNSDGDFRGDFPITVEYL